MKNFKSLVIALAFVSSTVSAQVQQSYQLETTQGWNLLGNSIQSTIYVANTFGDPNKVTSVWKWDTSNNKWLFYSPTLTTAELQSYTTANGFGVLTAIEGGEGYWVNTKVANNFGTQSGLGVVSPKLGVGWNLVASGGVADSKDVSVEMFSHIVKKAVDVVSVWQWGGSKWNFYAPSLYMDGGLAAYQSANNMGAISGSVSGAGKGFWVKGNGAKAAMPLPVLRSSYENKMAAIAAIGPQAQPLSNATEWFTGIVSLADFAQDGNYAQFAASFKYDAREPIENAKVGKFHFYQKSSSGKWMDITSRLLKDDTGCLHPRKSIVADFNNDGKPDILVACHGFDSYPTPTEQQRILLSQADGTYSNKLLPFTCYCHSGSAADVNGNGYADIVLTDTAFRSQPFYLMNNKDGTFTEDKTRMPASTIYVGVYSLELIDFNNDKKYDLWAAGTYYFPTDPTISIYPTIYFNDGANKFSDASKLPMKLTMDRVTALDVTYINGQVYMLLAKDGYSGIQIEKYDMNTKLTSVLYTHTGIWTQVNPSPWFQWIAAYKGNIVATDSIFPVSIPL